MDRKGSGFVVYGCNPNGVFSDSQGNLAFYTPNSFGVLSAITGVNGGNPFYVCGFEDGSPDAPFGLDGFIVNDNTDVPIAQIKRSDGKSTFRTIVFSPATPGNWTPAPDNVAGALDQLASRTPNLTGKPNAIVYGDSGGTGATADALLTAAPIDQYSRPQIRDLRVDVGGGAVWRQGAWQVDGDTQNVIGQGIVIYGEAGGLQDGSNGSFARIKCDRFAIRYIIGGVDVGYAWRVDPTHEYFNDDTGALSVEIVRATGKARARVLNANVAAYTVGTLPAGAEGDIAYATNGRKAGEGPGAGTGVPVYFSNGVWRAFSSDAAVAA
jgi:hypothetical protein